MSRRSARSSRLTKATSQQIKEAESCHEPIEDLPQKRHSITSSKPSDPDSSYPLNKKPVLKNPTFNQPSSNPELLNYDDPGYLHTNKEPCISLYLTSIPKTCSEQDINDNLSQYGEISNITLLTDSRGNSTGTGIVRFEKESSCFKAFKEGSISFNGTEIYISLMSYYDN